jgi:VWFA-related protein
MWAQDTAILGEFVEVELVLVDVIVEGRDGQTVLDLQREDFRIFQDGEPMEIAQFTAALGAATSASEHQSSAGPGSTLPGRHLIIFIDNVHLHPMSRQREVVLPMTDDRKALRTALKEQVRAEAVNLMADNADKRILETIQQVRAQYAQTPNGPDRACRDIGHVAHSHAQQVHHRVLGAISELDRFVNSLAGFEGPKTLLHVSDGIPLIAGSEAYRYASELFDGSGVIKGIPNAMDTTTSNGLRYNYWDPTKTWATLREFDTTSEWERLASNANTYQVSIYTFQAHQPSNRAGTVDSAPTSFEVEMDGERNKQDALFILADATGGATLLNGVDIESALTRLSDDSRSSYQLAYEPPTRGDGKQHKIRVEVDRAKVEVRHRKSFRSKGNQEKIADHLLSVLVHGQQENPLEVNLEVAEQAPTKNNLTQVQIRVRVPFEQLALLPDEGSRRGLFTVFVAVRSGRGRLTPGGQNTLPVLLPATENHSRDFEYMVEVPIWGTKGEVAVAVHDQIGGTVSYLRKNVRVSSDS